MTKRVFRIREGEPLLDIVSFGSAALHENGGRLTPEQAPTPQLQPDQTAETALASAGPGAISRA